MKRLQQGAIGAQIIIEVRGADLSGSTLSLEVLKPSGATDTWSATVLTDGTDGKVLYSTQSGDLDETGVYRVQVRVVGVGANYPTEPVSFVVKRNLS